MYLDEVFKNRKSTRAFLPERVKGEILRKILESTALAPSAGNLQAYEIYVVTNKEKKEGIARAAHGHDFISQAPVCLVFCACPEISESKFGRRGRNLFCIQDATIAATFAILKAVDEGLGTVWVGSFNEKAVAKTIGCEPSIPVVIIPIGFPAENPKVSDRRPLCDLVQYVD
ncbi:MAG: nitroreductase family protein [Candidatus Thermoplasmatota archaeon]|jgi:nitroreductase|nr:nitroreductase family protein [Candidatus Thermoplasmatota archaeon]